MSTKDSSSSNDGSDSFQMQDLPQKIRSEFIHAAKRGNVEKLERLIKVFGLSHPQSMMNVYELLRWAAYNNQVDMARILLESGASIEINTKKPVDGPLHYAVKHGSIEIVKLLLSHGADVDAPNKGGKTALYLAAHWNHADIFMLLRSYNASIEASEKDETVKPLHLAARKGNLQIVQHLLDYGQNVNCCAAGYYENRTPLHFAVEARTSLEVVQALVLKGANVNSTTDKGITPLHLACKWGNTDVVSSLLEYGADVHRVAENGRSAVHFAAQQLNGEIMRLVLEKGVDVNIPTRDGSTAVVIALKKGSVQVVELLLQCGVDVNTQTKNGRTLLSIAVDIQSKSLVNLILSKSPDVNNDRNRETLKKVVEWNCDGRDTIDSLLKHGLTVRDKDAKNLCLLNLAIEKGYSQLAHEMLQRVNALCSPT